MRKLVWMACLAYLLAGFGHIIIGSVLEPMMNAYQLDYRDGGQLIMNQFLGFLVGVLFAPLVIKVLGRRLVLLLALALFAASQLSLFLMLPWNVLLAIIPLGGAGLGLTETVLAGLIIGKLKEKKASIMVLTEVFFGVGALAVPVLSALLIANGNWNMVFLVVGAAVLISFCLWLFLRFDDYEPLLTKEAVAGADGDERPLKARYPKTSLPLVLVGSLFFFCYVGVEMTFPNYLPSILAMTSDLSPSVLALSITVFWGAMTIGRMIMVFVVGKVNVATLFLLAVFGQLAMLGLFAISPHYIIRFIVIFFAGLLMGGIFSLGLLVVNEGLPGLEDRTTSLLIAMGGLGGALLPRLTGSLLDHYSVQVTLLVIFAIAIVMTALMFLIFHFRKRLLREAGKGGSERISEVG
ncbi:MFS transporter [Shouchella tritolerans]|uniref:MFS transporter n=1 Tax=Shouchella tritolerans TaxID=2979466 RepID=UPI0021E70515|nr:MFS transporter [Shouchella tritolerans]